MLKDLWCNVQQFLFPRYCWLCGKRLMKGEKHLCTSCLLKLPRTNLHLQPGNFMEQLFWGILPVDRCTAYFYYHKDGITSELMYHLKYFGHPEVGEYLGHCAALEISRTSDFFEGIDVIIPVPLHPDREKKRGYNQCHYIAKGIATIVNIPVSIDSLVRTRANVTQTHKGREERQEGVDSLFCRGKNFSFAWKKILIVDDVCTTGSTLTSVMMAFNDLPDVSFRVLTLGIASDLH